MMPSSTRSEVRSEYIFKFSPEARRRPRMGLSSRLIATSVVGLCCRVLDCRHVCTVANGSSRLCSPLLFALTSIFTFRFSLGALANLIKIKMNSFFDYYAYTPKDGYKLLLLFWISF